MEIILRKKGEAEGDIRVGHANSAPCQNDGTESIPVKSEDGLLVKVPHKLASAGCSVSHDLRRQLVACYANCIRAARDHGAKSVVFPELGVENLYWDPAQSASSARKAIEQVFKEMPDDFVVCIEVDEDNWEVWDFVMRF